MSNMTTTQNKLKSMLQTDSVKQRLEQCLGDKANGFATSMLALVAQDKLLAESEPTSILQSAMTAATLDLPIQKDLGFAWIIAYRDNKKNQVTAQFQMGYKGFIQLALRTGQYASLNAEAVPSAAYKGRDDVGEPIIDWDEIDKGGQIAGYAFAFKLVNGFSKKAYWSKAKVEAHAKRFSQSFRKGYGPWKDDFDAMALKTVVKNTLNKWGILSVEMQKALDEDQKAGSEYVDNGPDAIDVSNASSRTNALLDTLKADTSEKEATPFDVREAAEPEPSKPKSEQLADRLDLGDEAAGKNAQKS